MACWLIINVTLKPEPDSFRLLIMSGSIIQNRNVLKLSGSIFVL